MKTREEVDALKANWLEDPCWDLYTTEGFEEYHEELGRFQAVKEAEWEVEREQELQKYADELGTDNLKLAEYVRRLERRIDNLEDRLTS
jgi:polyhydroxyalkanoate synthesis regulator phasin